MIRHRAWFVFLAAVAASCSGCGQGLIQERQAVVIRFEPNSRTLTCLFAYQGLQVGGGTGEGERVRCLDEAKRQLADFVSSGRKFGCFLFGRIDNFELGKGEPAAEKNDPGQIQVKDGVLAVDPGIFEAVRIKNEAFFLDPERGLCLSQTIRIEDYEPVVAALNAAISNSFAEKPAGEPPSGGWEIKGFSISEAAKRSLREAAKAGHRWIRIAPGRVELNFPVPPEDAKAILAAIEASPDDSKVVASLKAGIEDFQVTGGPDGISISAGDGNRPTIALRQGSDPNQQPRRDADLIRYARTLGLPFDRTPDVEALIRAFCSK